MGKRLISLLTALALAVSAFASLTVAPAGATVEDLNNQLFFPFIPNGEEYGDMGPWFGAVTIQNPNNVAITVQLQRANGNVITNFDLQPFASKTFNSSQLFGDGAGGGVRAIGPSAGTTGTGATRYTVFRGQNTVDTDGNPANGFETGFDQIPNPCGNAAPATVTIRQGDTLFDQWTGGADPAGDYTVVILAGVPNVIYIVWWRENGGDTAFGAGDAAGGARPQPGTQYTIDVTCAGGPAQPVGAPIAGVAKIVAPVASNSGRTSAEQEAVTGYTALPRADVDLGGQRNLVFPIVQVNNGWNSVLHITNFDNAGNCSVTVTLYQSPSGSSDPSFGQFIRLLGSGETWHIDLAAQGVPAGWVGQAWVSSDCDVAATVDRLKAAQPWGDPVNMALTNQALPTQAGNTTQALPLVFQAYNGWNTGMSIANLDANSAANVTITYYNAAGNVTGTESRTIQPRAMEFVYRPATTDVGIGGFGSALVTSNRPVLVAVDSVKYAGLGDDVGQALSYLAQRGVSVGQLFLPLFQKQGLLSGGNDNSGVALFNAGSVNAAVQLTVFDSSGARVAPTLTVPISVNLPPFGQFIFYAPNYAELPNGFQGAVVVDSVGFNVAGVSNNVNYDVNFDGSAAFNLQGQSTANVQVQDAAGAANAGDGTADFTVQGNLGFTTLVNVQTLFRILDVDDNASAYPDDYSFAAPPTDNNVIPATVAAGANNTGAINGFWFTNNPPPGADAFRVEWYLDVNGNGQVDAADVLIAAVDVAAGTVS